jgi:hypothetical protein
MWPSLETASHIADVANVFFIASLVVGVVSTILIVWMANVKESHWDIDRRASAERIAELNNETAWLHEKGRLTADAVVATAHAARDVAFAAQQNGVTSERLALAQGLITPGQMSEAARSFSIVPKVSTFAGKQFDAVTTSNRIELGVFLRSLRAALTTAGWVEVDRGDIGERQEQSNVGGGPVLVTINVDSTRDPQLLEAAETLASALNAEGIAATVNPKTETDAANVSVIHILVSPKQ